MAGFLKNASKAIGLAGDYNENKRPKKKKKNTEDGILCVTAIAGIIAGGWTVVKLVKNLFNNKQN